MSFDAIKWAKDQKTGSPTRKLILICLASYANDQNQCYPSHKTISNFTEVEKDTIINHLKVLQSLNLINIEKRFEKTEHEKMRQTSNLYTLNIPQYENHTHPPLKNTGTSPLKNQTQINQINNNIYDEDFLIFWKTYPRRDGSKKKAYELWQKVTKNIITKKDLFSYCEKFNKINKGKDIQYIPHLTTWLNQRRWETIDDTKKAKVNLNQLVG